MDDSHQPQGLNFSASVKIEQLGIVKTIKKKGGPEVGVSLCSSTPSYSFLPRGSLPFGTQWGGGHVAAVQQERPAPPVEWEGRPDPPVGLGRAPRSATGEETNPENLDIHTHLKNNISTNTSKIGVSIFQSRESCPFTKNESIQCVHIFPSPNF